MPVALTAQRIDKWLWAARFFKTRSLAVEAINGGKVHVEGQRVKPAKEVRVGMTVAVRTPGGEYTVVVRGLNAQRRPAAEAQGLYEETAESLRLREEAAELGRAQAAARERGAGRPTKRDRRQIGRFTGED